MNKKSLIITLSVIIVLGIASAVIALVLTKNSDDNQPNEGEEQMYMKEIAYDSTRDVAISEICPTPSEGAYEFIEIYNTSDKPINLKEYSLFRFGFANGSAQYERTGINMLMGFHEEELPSMDKLTLETYDISVEAKKTVVLWFVSYDNREKSVEDFKAYWSSKGSDMASVNVVRVEVYKDGADVFPATKVHEKAGTGFLPDMYSGVVLSLIKNDNLSALSVESAVPADYHNIADCMAMYFVHKPAKIDTSYCYYNFYERNSYVSAAVDKLTEKITTMKSSYVEYPYDGFVTGALDDKGRPAVRQYFNKESSVAIFIDNANESIPNPGYMKSGQFAEFYLHEVKKDEATGNLAITGYTKENFTKAGFDINFKGSHNAEALVENNIFKCVISDMPASDGDVVLEVVPYGILSSGERINGKAQKVCGDTKNITINDKFINGLHVTYLVQENATKLDDITGFSEAAKLLANELAYYSGTEVVFSQYDEKADYPQIVIASVEAGAKFIPSGKTMTNAQYGIFEANGNLYVIGGTAPAAEYASQLLIKHVEEKGNNRAELTELCSDKVNLFNVSDAHLPLTPGSDYRIMTMNVERYELNGNLARMENFVNLALYYDADVLGFQEYCAKFTEVLTPKLESNGYVVLGNQADLSGGVQNFTPLAYKKSRFNLVASGWFVMDGCGPEFTTYPGHNVTWAVLEDKSSGEKFAVTTTHFFHKSDRTIADPVRAENAQEIVAFTKKLMADYGCQVINMGDYNTYTTDVGYPFFKDSGVVRDSRYYAIRDYSDCRTTHADGSSAPSNGSEFIGLDLFFVTDKVQVLRNRCAMNKLTSEAGDHFPVYVDVSFG